MNPQINANEIAGTRDQILIHALNDTIFAQKQLIAKLNEEIERLRGINSNQVILTPMNPGPITVPNFTPWVSPPIQPGSPFVPPGITITCQDGTGTLQLDSKGNVTCSDTGIKSFTSVNVNDLNNLMKDALKE